MQKVIVVAFVAVVLIMFMGIVSAVTILDHSMCKDIDEDVNPINLTTKFNTSDMKAVSWVKIKDMSVRDNVRCEWILPNASIFSAFPNLILAKRVVMIEGPSRCAFFLYIDNQPPANIPGNWHVNFYYNDEKKFTETFTISAPTPKPTPTVTPTCTPSPTPTPEEGVPGFEAVFAIVGLLAVGYLLRRRK